MNALTQTKSANFLTPTSLQEAMQIADLLAGSDIVPKDYQRKPGNILVAMQWGAEIGLQPLQAMQNIAVINGRPSIWGDAMLALVRSSGLLEFIREELSDDKLTAICTVKRKGEEEVVSEFSMEDAKKAGLAGKQGPWTQYPKRMMKLRARSYALRDVFPDVIKGMAIAEEEKDKEIDVTPATSSSSQEAKKNIGSSALKARLAKSKAVEVEPKEIDLAPFYAGIEQAETLDELKSIGADIAALNLGEPAKSEIGNAFKLKRENMVGKIITGLEAAESIEQLNVVLETQFEPFTNVLSEANIKQVNDVYERMEAGLTP